MDLALFEEIAYDIMPNVYEIKNCSTEYETHYKANGTFALYFKNTVEDGYPFWIDLDTINDITSTSTMGLRRDILNIINNHNLQGIAINNYNLQGFKYVSPYLNIDLNHPQSLISITKLMKLLCQIQNNK